MHSEYQDVYQRVTNQIIEAMEKGAGDWKMPWHQTAGEIFVPINSQSKKPYRGINILSLWAAAGAAFLCAELRLSNESRPDHAAYVTSWLRVLKNDKRAIFTAASKAQAAVDYMQGKQEDERLMA